MHHSVNTEFGKPVSVARCGDVGTLPGQIDREMVEVSLPQVWQKSRLDHFQGGLCCADVLVPSTKKIEQKM